MVAETGTARMVYHITSVTVTPDLDFELSDCIARCVVAAHVGKTKVNVFTVYHEKDELGQ